MIAVPPAVHHPMKEWNTGQNDMPSPPEKNPSGKEQNVTERGENCCEIYHKDFSGVKKKVPEFLPEKSVAGGMKKG